ncbi:MAG: hypothetical protein AAFQ94_30580 [Bacteroidota bacterium]
MTLPKKGIRKIKVDGVAYYFIVNLEYYDMTIQTVVGLVSNPNKQFYFSAQQGDENIVTEKSEKYNPGSITPGIVSRAIRYANSQTDWKNSNEMIHLYYSENLFSLKSKMYFDE